MLRLRLEAPWRGHPITQPSQALISSSKWFFLMVWILFFLPTALAQIEVVEFENAEIEADYHALIDELRCPKCRNQNLAESNAPIAVDLRTKVHQLLHEGATPQEVRQYMIDRYGDSVTYQPPLKWQTILLWILPWLVIITVIIMMIRRHGRGALDDPDAHEIANEMKDERDDEIQNQDHPDEGKR